MPDPSAPWPLVGRGGTLDRCRRSLAGGRGVLLAGGAGVGKTAVARFIADELDDDGADVTRLAATTTSGLPIDAFGAVASERNGVSSQVVVIDDVQLLDDDAAALLHRLTHDRRITIVGTLRTGESVPDAVTALWKDDFVDRIDLEPLNRADVDTLIDAVLAGPVDAADRKTLWELTLGWPLMFRELLRSALDTGQLRQVSGLWRFVEPPRSTRLDELISDRLTNLDPEVFRLVEMIALGEPLGFELLRQVTDLATLDAAERTGVIEIVHDDVRRDVRLGHPMFGDVIQRTMTEARRAQVAAELLALIETTSMRRRDDIVRATTWQLQAGGRIVTDDMVLAARRALYADKQRLAIELATRALKGDPGRKDVALLLAEALISVGEAEQAGEVAADHAPSSTVGSAHEPPADAVDEVETDRARELVLNTKQRSFALFWGFGDADAAIAVIDDSVGRLPRGPWRDELLAERALHSSNQGRHLEARQVIDPMIDRLEGDDSSRRAFVTAAISACCSRSIDGRCVDALDLCQRAFAVGSEIAEQVGMTQPGIFIVSQATALLEVGRFGEAEDLARAARDMVVAEGRSDGQAWFSMTLGRALLARGAFVEAEQRFVEASAAFAGIHSPGPRHWCLAGAVMAAASRGDRTAAHRFHAERLGIPEHPAAVMAPEVCRSEAYLLLVDGDRQGAIRRLREAIDEHAAGGADSLLSWLLHDVVRFGGTIEADEALVFERCEGELAPARAALAAADRAHDADGLERVAAAFGTIGSPVFAAEAALLAASRWAAEGDRRAEARCRQTAAAFRDELGSGPITTLDLLDSTGPDVLTKREREVAELAAGGRTNKEIAEALFVSVRTVENHLQRVYDKLGAGGRRQLADALGR